MICYKNPKDLIYFFRSTNERLLTYHILDNPYRIDANHVARAARKFPFSLVLFIE